MTSTGSDAPIRAMDAYEHVQAMRPEARQIAKNASPADLKSAASLLENALTYLAREDISERATGNIYLYARGHDVRFDLAKIYSCMGDKERALSTLEAMQHFAWVPALGQLLAKDDAFVDLRDELRFKHLLAVEATPENIWKTRAIATAYKERLSVEERVAGLSLFWAEARHGFVFFDHAPALSWDEVYMDYLSKVIAAETTRDYYGVMMQLAPLLKDSHTNIDPPKELTDVFYARPPLSTGLIENKVLIQSVRSVSLTQRICIGDEVVALDGEPVEQYVEKFIAPFVSSSTPQDRDVRLFSYQLLLGDATKPIRLGLQDAAGTEREEIVARSGYTDLRKSAQFQFEMLPDNIACLSLDHFESDAGVKAFEGALPQIMKARALVLDVRKNGGGSTHNGLAILSYLSKEPISGSISYRRAESALDRARGAAGVVWAPLPDNGEPFRQAHDQTFVGPVAVLVGPQTFSAAEDFVVAFESMQRGITVGKATAGSTGQPLVFDLPGGGMARICVKRDVYADGREFVGKGIRPTIEVAGTVEDLRAGRDAALGRAIKELSGR
jgi:carboxyl-terminal processing protease